MKNILCDDIEITGISDVFPSSCNSFKEFYVQKKLCIPIDKLDIKEIISANISATINKTQPLSSPISISNEGQILTGNKLVVHGDFHLKIGYISQTINQSIHTSCFKIPFSNYIVMNKDFNIDLDVFVTPYIEDVFLKSFNKREFFTSILILIDAKYC